MPTSTAWGSFNQYSSTSLHAHPTNLKLTWMSAGHGPVTSPHAVPVSGSPWLNGYYQDAEVTLSVSGGTLSALTITGINGVTVSQVVPASTTFYRFTLSAGATYTPTFTGTLTHTVTQQ